MNSPVRLGVSPTAASTPTGVFNQRFEALFPCTGTLRCEVYLAPQLFFPVYLHSNVGPPSLQATALSGLPVAALLGVLSTWLPVSAPPTGLDECFFFKSLVVRFPYSLIFWQYWLFFVFKLLLSFFWLCEEAQCVYLHLHLGQKSLPEAVYVPRCEQGSMFHLIPATNPTKPLGAYLYLGSST
ncbi:hypothetical protein HJG60_010197 [Phyllostomus discolor]|uniref:Uncharacterized protein n=1 Tax=Phyllostomus discolor TaxID=89673 RepID=A0A834B1C7_9CHIR|nr:hypothetical protein HJG60_010197 [Phyllostomus discolor]